MANLIPLKARKRVRVEYWMRSISVWMLLVGTALLMVLALQIPAYVLVNNQISILNSWYQEVDEDNQQFKVSENIIRKTNRLNVLLGEQNEQPLFGAVVAEVEAAAGNEVVVQDFSLERKDGMLTGLVVSGEAATRSSLANFKDALEDSPMFESAVLPLSNLAKDADIPFRINITMISEVTDL